MSSIAYLGQVSGELARLEVKLPTYVNNYVLAADASVEATTPAKCAYCIITSTTGVYVGNKAVVDSGANGSEEPTGDITDGTGLLFIPSGIGLKVGAAQNIYLVAQTLTATVVSVAAYQA